jgi:hypothetical protein
MLFFVVFISYSLKYIYLRVCLLMQHLVAIYSFVAGWVFFMLLTQLVQMSV